MASKTDEARLTDYLLGESPEHDRARLEEEYFADDEAFERMLVAEDELIDAYVRGELSARERKRFEEGFMASPRGRERVRFARTLADAVSEAQPREPRPEAVGRPWQAIFGALVTRRAALISALAVASLLLFVGLPWLLTERARRGEELLRARAERSELDERVRELERRAAAERARSEELLAQLEAARAQPAKGGGEGDEAGPEKLPPPDLRRPRGGTGDAGAAVARRSPDRTRVRGRSGTLVAETNATIGPSFESRRVEDLPHSAADASAIFVLTPGQVRGGGPNILKVPDGATSIEFRLKLGRDQRHESYSAVIETADGLRVWGADSVKPQRTFDASGRPRRTADAVKTIDLPAVPASALPPRDYVLLLNGRRADGRSDVVADYSFRITKK